MKELFELHFSIYWKIDLFIQLLYIIFICTTSIQVLQFLAIGIGFLTHIRKKTENKAELPSVSVIVCTRNRLPQLKQLVDRILKQNYSAYELIIVDDRSSDGTDEFLSGLETEHDIVKSIRINRTPDHINSKKYALTIGIKNASYYTLLLTDDDCVPYSDEWVSSMASSYKEKTDFVLGYSAYQRKDGFLNAFIRMETVWTAVHYLGFAKLGMPYMGVGRNLSYKKKVFEKNKGFSEIQSVIGGDDDLFVNANANHINTDVCLEKESVMVSMPKEKTSEFFSQKLRHLSVGTKYRLKHRLLLGILSSAQILFWFSFIILAFASEVPYVIGVGYGLRILCMFFAFSLLCRRVNERLNPLFFTLFDFLYCIYYPITGIVALASKRTKWM